MYPVDSSLDNAEKSASNVSTQALPRTSGEDSENGVNGSHAASNERLSSEAGPSRLSSVGNGRSDSPQPTVTPKLPTKRRRIDAELAFSSPGPAFQLQQNETSEEAQADINDGSGKARRPRRSTTLTNGNSNESRKRRTSTSGSKREEDATGSMNLADSISSVKSKLNNGKARAKDTNEGGPRRSVPTSAVKSEPDPDEESAAISEEEVVAPTLQHTRPRPQITPLTALDPQAPLPEILHRRRSERIALAQSDLEDVHDGHDMLVRELFHLTKFVTMVGYDPDIARTDQSDVFTTFKHAHDLRFSLDDTDSGAAAATSGRATRRRVNARLESLSLKRPEPPSSPVTPIASKQKADGKRSTGEGSRGRRSSSFIGARSRANDAHTSESEGSDDADHGSEEDGEGAIDGAYSRSEKGKGRATDSGSVRKGAAKRARLSSASQSNRVKADETSSDSPVKRSGARKSKALDELDSFIVRHRPRQLPKNLPPLHILAHNQVPAPRRFGGNLDALLNSFNLLQDSEGPTEGDDLQTYIKLDQRWRAGLPIHPEAGSTTRHVAHKGVRNKSHHDHILDAVVASYTQMRQYSRLRQQNSRKVARMVAQHWERQLGTSEREKKAEERRVRALAKWTLREVLKQWRLAVNVVRARRAAAEKAEKEKLDKEQLNAILEQSTAMLKKQHEVMTRADSLIDSDDEASDRTSYGSDGDTEHEESEVDDQVDGSIQQESMPVSREPSLVSTPAPDGTDDIRDQKTSAVSDVAVIAREDTADLVESDTQPSRRPQRRSARSITGRSFTAKDFRLEADDVEFDVAGDDGEQEDAELERQMWEEDEEDDSEDAGLEADANIPIEELLKRYGYGQSAEDGTEDDEAGENAANDDRDDEAETHAVKDEEENAATEAPIALEDFKEREERPAEGISARNKLLDVNEAAAETGVAEQSDALLEDDHSDSESAATSGRRSSRRSMTRASSIVSSDRHAGRSRQPFLLRGQLRPYQQIGFEWLASLYANGVNGILADEMGLGKTIQTISLLAHLACDKGVWGPHLVVAPTSVMLNWEVEFKKFLPGFKILSYYGNQKERKEKRVGWNTENSFNVCITSYQLVLADQHIFRRKPWVYLVLDEAHHIKNFRSQRWQTLLGFNSQRRLLLTGTPLQNNLMDLWSLMYFLMPNGATELPGGGAFANMKDFQDWFSNPLDKAIEGGTSMNDETRAMVQKLHAVLRPYLLRRLKSEVEKELPSKYEHVITCRLSKRQRFLYNDFMSRAKTRESLASGNYLSIINCLMQLRKVCNHPDLFEVRPIVTSFAMSRSVVADYEIKDLLVRRHLLQENVWGQVDLDVTNFRITNGEEHLTAIESRDLRRLNAAKKLPHFRDAVPDPPELDTWTLDGFERTRGERRLVGQMERWKHVAYLNQYRCTKRPVYGSGLIKILREAGKATRLEPLEQHESNRKGFLTRCDSLLRIVQSRSTRRENMQPYIDRFAFVTPRAVAVDMPRWALPGLEPTPDLVQPSFDTVHPVAVKLHIAFPDASLLQYDCGKLQQLDILMRRLKEGNHRILIFTQMTRVLDILESFLNNHGYRYLRLDGATKVESRQALTEKFNRDPRITAFILSTRSGGLGINLTGADTVLFYDLDWNAAIEAQCMDRAHRIGQTRDVHIYRFVTEHTIEENMLRKANQKRLLDSVVIQEGEFNTDTLVKRLDWRDMLDDSGKIGDVEVAVGEEADGVGARDVERAFLEAEDEEDRQAALKAREEMFVDDEEFDERQQQGKETSKGDSGEAAPVGNDARGVLEGSVQVEETEGVEEGEEEEEEEGGTIDDYLLAFVERDWEFFA
ncbi:hypothetical protein PHSY_005333 [Pseudozyma hubeiensis SY62]|uniref:Helicase SWR1 n=1 Tax=Pseudozyma hubeiensis (strain SY62) TaxID=1305764 RepID=R9P8R0_PSEHS|nr:hypothetical protein PHSY_005333 [Pseudozyma hubeiensis SY62]GAC97746.1 hypothetical protein PHSY_005333 [Pseudozyma hubeiensis SY62]